MSPVAYFVSQTAGWLGPYRGQAALIGVGLLFEAAFSASVPLAFRLLIDRAIVPRDTRLLFWLLAALTIGVVIVAVIGLARDYLYARLCSWILRDLRLKMFDQLHRLFPGDIGEDDDGAMTAHFSTDLSAIEHAIVSAVPWALLPLLDVVIGTALLFALEWRLALVAALVFPVSLLGPRLVAPHASRASLERKNREAKVLADIHENVGARRMVRGFGLHPWMRHRFSLRVDDLVSSSTRTAFLGALVERSAAIGILFLQVIVLGVGALIAFNGSVTIGTLVSFQSLFMTVSWSLSYLTQYLPNLVVASGGLQRIDQLLAAAPQVTDVPGARTLPEVAREIRFERVAFGFPGKPAIFSELDLVVHAGERVAIVGGIGSGKSTVLRLIARFADPNGGRVLIDGHDLREVTQSSLRQQIGIVFQDMLLVDDTIRENIRLGRRDATDSEIEAVSSLIGLHRIVETLPRGYDTMVGTRGDLLSGGQRQLVALARAVIRDPAILLFDEPTSALDAESDRVVKLAIDLVSRGRTVVTVTHRLALATDVDRVLVLSEGRLAEEGSPAELLAAGTLYSRLWQQHQLT